MEVAATTNQLQALHNNDAKWIAIYDKANEFAKVSNIHAHDHTHIMKK